MTLIFESSSRTSALFEHDPFRKPATTFRDHALEYPDDHDKANHHADRGQTGPETQPFLDDAACARAVAVEQESFSKKARAARDQRQDDEQAEIITGKARRDRHELVGDRRQPFKQNDEGAVLRVA